VDAKQCLRQTAVMIIELRVVRAIAAPAAAVFALALDSERFPATFSGCGPIPSLRRITPLAPPAVGATREVESSDDSLLTERITAFDPPRRHAYTLSGIRPPLAWLVRTGNADWTFEDANGGTRVTWRYAFELTGVVAAPLAWPLLHIFMRGAMGRSLAAMARILEPAEATAR
jgi:carbon monoxide dehydrogenase subunit G